MAAPVFSPQDQKLSGVLVAQLPLSAISRLMSDGQQWAGIGLGDTGDSFLVDNAGLLLTGQRSNTQPVPAAQEINGLLQGKQQIRQVQAKDGEEYLQRSETVSLGGHDVLLITQQQTAELYQSLSALQQQLWFTSALTALLLGVAVFWLTRRLGMGIAKPLEQLSTQLSQAAEDKDLRQQFASQRDTELSQTTTALQQLFSRLSLLLRGVQAGRPTEQRIGRTKFTNLYSQQNRCLSAKSWADAVRRRSG
ncbi:MAG: cache domain-containing protein [Marinagarivorans sp.]|nr:cache domain-containing protein [Marinagarivorans sp.]